MDERIKKIYNKVKLKNWQVVVLLLLCVMSFSVYVRIQPMYLTGVEDSIESQVHQNIYNSIEGQLRSEFPSLPPENLRERAIQEYNKIIKAEGENIKASIQQQISNSKQFYQDENGDTYLLAIDPYHWYQFTKNYIDHGYMGEEIVDGESRNMLQRGRIGTPAPLKMHPLFQALIYKIGQFFNKSFSVLQACFLSPLILVTLAIIPAFFIGHRISGNLGGTITSLVVAGHAGLMARTVAGFSDSDAWHVLLPLTAIWLYLESYYTTNRWKRSGLLVGCGSVIALHATLWSGWWFTLDFIIATSVFMIIYELVLRRKFRVIEVKNIITILTTCALAQGLLWVLLGAKTFFSGIQNVFYNALIKFPLGYISLKQVAVNTLWPNVLTTVAELNAGNFASVISNLGGPILFYGTLIGIGMLFTYVYRNDKKDIRLGILTLIWLCATFFAAVSSMRFIALVVVAYAIGLGAFFGLLKNLLIDKFGKDFFFKTGIYVIVALMLIVILAAPLKGGYEVAKNRAPSMNDNWYGALDKIKQDSTMDNAMITSWWDFGHWFKAVAERPVTFDGGDQGRRIHWVGKLLASNNEAESYGILRMLNCNQTAGFDVLNNYTQDTVKSINILDDVLRVDTNTAYTRLLQDVTKEQAEHVLKNTHCENTWEHYLIVSRDMIGKSGVWAHFGLWDFEKAQTYQTYKGELYDDGIELDVYNSIQESSSADYWVSPWPQYISRSWSQCNINQNATEIQCPVNANIGNNVILKKVVIDINNTAWFDIQQSNQYGGTGTARLIPGGFAVFNNETKLQRREYENSELGYEVLYDLDKGRVAIMDPKLTDSLFTNLYFLEGQHNNRFELFYKTDGIYVYKVVW